MGLQINSTDCEIPVQKNSLTYKTSNLEEAGFALIQGVFDSIQVNELLHTIETAFQQDENFSSIRSSRGTVFAARNVLEVVPEIATMWRNACLEQLIEETLGENAGLVRALYFDKPSHRSWSLPFHKDMTIAVRDNSIPSTAFSKPTTKADVPHVEAPTPLLQQMLTLRIHLDNVTADNGPLQVIAGSHHNGKQSAGYIDPPVAITCQAGDVLAMRPLLSHASGHSNPDKELHRRILHLEFSGCEILQDDYQWHTFLRV